MMEIFFAFAFGVGICLLFFCLYQINRIKKYESFLYASSLDEVGQAKVQERFEQNDWLLYGLGYFDSHIGLKIGTFCVLFALFFYSNMLWFGLKQNSVLLFGIVLLVALILAPSLLHRFIIQSRITKIGLEIPRFVDLLAICVQSGMSIEAALGFLWQNASKLNPTFAPFLNILILKMEVSGLEEALAHLQQELPSPEVSMMCQTLKQSIKYGSGIYDLLMDLSAEIQQTSLLQTEEAIGQLSAKLSIPLILFFMFPVIIVIAAPGVMRVLGGFL